MGMGISIALMALGAILTFALERDAEGINLDTVGIILMIVGAIGLVVSMLLWSSFSPYNRARHTTVVDKRETL